MTRIKSWLGNGQNLPISADQLGQILARELPKVVDQASLEGHLPYAA